MQMIVAQTIPLGMQNRRPEASAILKGGMAHPGLGGTVRFYTHSDGVLVVADVWGLPRGGTDQCPGGVFGLHIHEGPCCCQKPGEEPFFGAGGHYNPRGCPHPYHAGDLPPLFAHEGKAWYAVLLHRFTVDEILGRPVIVHGGVDDFSSQPAGNAGPRIGCGIIQKT